MHKHMMNEYTKCNRSIHWLNKILVCSHVAAKMVNSWCRAEVRSVNISERTAYVRAVDYGTRGTVKFDDIRRLDRMYAEVLPEQTMECVLTNMDFGKGTLRKDVVEFIWEIIRDENVFSEG